MPFDQLVPYWDPANKQMQGPSNVPSGSVETMAAVQATGASATIPLGIATRAGLIKDVRVAAITPLTGNDTYTLDVKKNGTSILSGGTPMSLLSTTTARTSVVGTLDSTKTTVAVGDFFEVVATYTHGTGTAPANVVGQIQLILN
jgi:hypothetical protein